MAFFLCLYSRKPAIKLIIPTSARDNPTPSPILTPDDMPEVLAFVLVGEGEDEDDDEGAGDTASGAVPLGAGVGVGLDDDEDDVDECPKLKPFI